MKRGLFRRPIGVAGLTAVLVCSLTPVTDAALSGRDNQAAKNTLTRVAEAKVTVGPAGAMIQWRISFAVDNLGFNIYREQGGIRTQVNPEIIAGSALIAGQGIPLSAGFSYQWLDRAGSLDCRYYLEDLDLNGTRTMNGPLLPVWNESAPQAKQSKTINDVEAQDPVSVQTGGPAETFGQQPITPAAIENQWAIVAQPGLKIGITQAGWYRVTQPEMVAAGFSVTGDSRNLRLFVDGRETPIEVSRGSGPLGANDFIAFYGIGVDVPSTDTHVYYLINGAQTGLRLSVFGELHADDAPPPLPVTAAGTLPNTEARNLWNPLWPWDLASGAVENEKAKQPTAARGLLPGERQQFVEVMRNPVPALTSPSPPPNSNLAKAPAQKVSPVKSAAEPRSIPGAAAAARPQSYKRKRSRRRRKSRHALVTTLTRRNHAAFISGPAASFLYTSQLKERSVYFTALLNGDTENFFGQAITPSPVVETLTLNDVQTDSTGSALLETALQGTSNQSHLVSVFLNDVMIGTISFSFQDYRRQTFLLKPSQLREGANTIKFVQGNTNDVSLVDYVRVTYPHVFRAEANSLSFTSRSNQSTTIDGFTTPDVRVLDISDPFSVQEVRAIIQPGASGFTVTVPSSGLKSKKARTLLALPAASFRHPASITSNQASALNQSSNAADLVIISHQDFIPSLPTLVAQRQAQGFAVMVVNVEDVYDEFSYGLHSPQAIKDFLARASAQWSKPPRYVLLVGDGSYDPRDYFHLGSFDFVPTKLVDTAFMETGSDDSLSDFNNDGIPEIPIGRLPVRTAADADREISKIVNFSPASVPQTALMVADAQGSYFYNFEQASDALIPLLPANMQSNVQKVYRAQQPSDATARSKIINAINSGTAMVNYSGHGNVDVWTGAPIFSGSDAMGLTNGNKLPLVIVMDCLNGYFVAPAIDSISESLMKAPNGGAVASFSSSGLTIPTGQHEMGQKLFQLLYSGAPIALGDATRQAKAATTDMDVRRTWILFGDPTMKIR
jgi:Peptidase family C25